MLKVIAKGSLSHGVYLYEADLELSESNKALTKATCLCNSVNYIATNLWHSRLGNLSDRVLQFRSNKVHFNIPKDFSSQGFTLP